MVVTADSPRQPIERGLPGPGMLAHVAVSKYCDHIPLNRQSGMFARQGLDLAPSTLGGWMGSPLPAGPVLPKSPLGTAINYCLGNWKALVRYAQDGKLDIDNNASERDLRPIATARRNYTFFGSDNGGRTAAVLYSLIASAKRHGLDPFVYLRDVLARISDHPSNKLHELLPDYWKLAHTAPAPEQV